MIGSDARSRHSTATTSFKVSVRNWRKCRKWHFSGMDENIGFVNFLEAKQRCHLIIKVAVILSNCGLGSRDPEHFSHVSLVIPTCNLTLKQNAVTFRPKSTSRHYWHPTESMVIPVFRTTGRLDSREEYCRCFSTKFRCFHRLRASERNARSRTANIGCGCPIVRGIGQGRPDRGPTLLERTGNT